MGSIERIGQRIYGTSKDFISISTIRTANERAASCMPHEQVAVFVGGTGGIGESTAYEFFRRTRKPKAYIVGRSAQHGKDVVENLKHINPQGEAIMLEADVSLLRNVDEMCAILRQRETKIHQLFLTAGYMTLKGRDETAEGLDKKMVVNYYARIRCILNLMPLLTAATAANELSRVITVLAAGSEDDVHFDDLDLRHHFSLHTCLAHCVVMTDFIIEELARRYPSTAFSHSYPGTIKTGITSGLSGPVRLAVKVLYTVMTPWLLNLRESGERHFFQMSNACYPAADAADFARPVVPVPEGMSVVCGSDGVVGTGSYLLDWDGSRTGDENVLAQCRAKGGPAMVWQHTMDMFDQAEQRQQQYRKRLAAQDLEHDRRQVPNLPGWRPS